MRKATGSYRTYSVHGKTAVLVSDFGVEDLPFTDLQPRFWRLEWRTCPWAEHTNDILLYYIKHSILRFNNNKKNIVSSHGPNPGSIPGQVNFMTKTFYFSTINLILTS